MCMCFRYNHSRVRCGKLCARVHTANTHTHVVAAERALYSVLFAHITQGTRTHNTHVPSPRSAVATGAAVVAAAIYAAVAS